MSEAGVLGDGDGDGDGSVFTLHRGSTPLVVSLPHVGKQIPQELRVRHVACDVARAHRFEDISWHLDQLYLANGASCAPALCSALARVLEARTSRSRIVDGRFKGGYIARHHGRPHAHRHAVQPEMAWRCDMAEEPPYEIDPERAAALHPVLGSFVRTMLEWRPDV